MATPHRTLRTIPGSSGRGAEIEVWAQPGVEGRVVLMPKTDGAPAGGLVQRAARAGFTVVLFASGDREAVVAAFPGATLVTDDRASPDAIMDRLLGG